MSNWHTCETTHCRAGWVTHLAGDAGKALESFFNTPLAALLIYRASSPHLVHMNQFFENDETAIAAMKRLAEIEAKETP